MTGKGILGTPVDSPEKVFVALWLRASQWDATTLLLAPCEAAITRTVTIYLENEDKAQVARNLRKSIPAGESQEDRRKVISIMWAVDSFFARIHPRSAVLSPALLAPLKIPHWLRELKERRKACADYGEFDDVRLIARGPLTRQVRAENESSAVNFSDKFSALEVVPKTLKLQQRQIRVVHKVFSAGAATGAVRSSLPGKEKIVVVPVAEKKDDLQLKEREEAGRQLIRYQVSDSFEAAQLFITALENVGRIDIAIAPEFVMPGTEADKIPDLIATSNKIDCTLIVAGTGLTVEQQEGLSWNEAQIFNGFGTELWRQRKLWPAGLGRKRATDCGVSNAGPGLGYEDTASGEEIVIADVDGMGRCAVLICQDLEGHPFAGELVSAFQPDWIFTPVLDPGISEGNWAHQRAFALSKLSHARFIVASSTTLSRRIGEADEPCCILAIGPLASTDTDHSRQINLSQIAPGSCPGYASIEWGGDGWKKSNLGTK